jgi:hypothetical protein
MTSKSTTNLQIGCYYPNKQYICNRNFILKKGSLIVILFLLSIVAQCQIPRDSAKRKGFSIEPIVGIGTSESVQHGTNNLGWKAGCNLVYMFNDYLGVSSGLQMQYYSTEVVTKTDTNTFYNLGVEKDAYYFYANYNFTYLELPIILRYVYSQNQEFGIFAEAGFNIEFLIKGKEQSCNEHDSLFYPGPSGSSTGLYTVQISDITPKANLFDLQGRFALGFFIPISQKCSIITDFSINKGLTNVGNSGNDFYNANYYYNQFININNGSPSIFNYGTNFSLSFNIRLNIKLGN